MAFEYYLTEISRRFALTTNSVSAAVNSESGLSGMLIYKQGIINQGGPADIMLRRTLIPDDFDPAVDNPYAFENLDCAEWVLHRRQQPQLPAGRVPLTGDQHHRQHHRPLRRWTLTTIPARRRSRLLTMAATRWNRLSPRCMNGASATAVPASVGCEDDNDLDDQSWENPYDVAKGHRGFLDGDLCDDDVRLGAQLELQHGRQ